MRAYPDPRGPAHGARHRPEPRGGCRANAYIPLLVVGLLARFDIVPLEAPYNLLASTPVLIIVAVLLAIEVFADKIPAVDSVNDVVQTFIRPVAGGLLFAASVNIGGDWVKIAAIVLGVVTAGGVHAAKATARPVINGNRRGRRPGGQYRRGSAVHWSVRHGSPGTDSRPGATCTSARADRARPDQSTATAR